MRFATCGSVIFGIVAVPSVALALFAADVARFVATVEAPAPPVTITTTMTPVPPFVGNAGLASTEVGDLRSSGLLTSTPIAADHEGLRADALQRSPWPTARLPPHWISGAQFAEAVMASPWPSRDWVTVVAIAFCESGDVKVGEIDIATTGDNGLARGPLKVRIDAHPDIAGTYDLDELRGNLAGAYQVSVQAERAFGDRFQPWKACR